MIQVVEEYPSIWVASEAASNVAPEYKKSLDNAPEIELFFLTDIKCIALFQSWTNRAI